MMLLERWGVAAVLGIGLVSMAGFAPGQTSSRKSQVVQPKQGPPPDQAQQPDPPAQVESNAEPEQAPEPDPPAAPDQAAQPPATTTPNLPRETDQNPQEAATPDQKMPTDAAPEQIAPAEVAPEVAPQVAPEAVPVQRAADRTPPKPTPPAPAPPAAPVGNAAHQQVQKETATLLQLAQELRTEIEKAGSNTLSLAALRKADEIQKLTKNLKEEMKEEEQVPAGK